MQLGSGDVPQLIIEAPDELAAARSRLEAFDTGRLGGVMRLVGLDRAGEPIRVVLAPEGSTLARRAPPPIAGFAASEESLIVRFLPGPLRIRTTRSKMSCTMRWRTC